MNVNKCRRCIIHCKKDHDKIAHKYLGEKWPKVSSAPDPSLIVWENLGKGKIDRCGLSSLTNILAFILLVGGFTLLLWILET